MHLEDATKTCSGVGVFEYYLYASRYSKYCKQYSKIVGRRGVKTGCGKVFQEKGESSDPGSQGLSPAPTYHRKPHKRLKMFVPESKSDREENLLKCTVQTRVDLELNLIGKGTG